MHDAASHNSVTTVQLIYGIVKAFITNIIIFFRVFLDFFLRLRIFAFHCKVPKNGHLAKYFPEKGIYETSSG